MGVRHRAALTNTTLPLAATRFGDKSSHCFCTYTESLLGFQCINFNSIPNELLRCCSRLDDTYRSFPEGPMTHFNTEWLTWVPQ